MTPTWTFPGVAVVTGAGGTGIGAATAKAFASAGCERIAITDLNPASLDQTREAILASCPQTRLLVKAGDISDESFVESFISEVVDAFGRLDYAVNCAGILGDAMRTTETSTAVFDHINNINYRGAWFCSRAELRQMVAQDPLPSHDPNRAPQRGAIVNVASQLGIVGRPSALNALWCELTASDLLLAAYCSSKAAVIAMTRSDAIDYSADGIRVNCVCPGVIETPMTTYSEEIREHFQPAVEIAPMKRMGKPEEVADSILFLCSTLASFVQGHALVVDGGYIIN
ncbi:SDR family NAD(P)-dependent oxidoreductase [Aspergillus vadensis CBS 113365]|uniref:Oxidoreductase n=1 Tax=Aspergillus vadensis (strain CBS 113365 / IMI 142717 / IBT 24658) TaxID=1448311 RepID=A0A319CNS9_ASPVC|nr:oxidoreductase [Aspergillus vadensis CBS 113365]PYH70012.1 oxidoreductase [Aspergillus vadensis CBS 113365]